LIFEAYDYQLAQSMNKDAPTTPKGGVWQKILDLLHNNLGQLVTNDQLRQATGQDNYARRLRELRAEGWQIKYSVKPSGYILESDQKAERNADIYVNLRLRTEVLERDNFTCQDCGYTQNDKYPTGEKVKLEVDHIIPLAQGGKTEVENLQTLCSNCNAGKKAKFAYSKVDPNETSFVVRVPNLLLNKLKLEADMRAINVRALIIEVLTNFFKSKQ
jgi:hypothetical protein